MLICNTYIGGGGGSVLASQVYGTDIVSLSIGGAVDSGLNLGGAQAEFAKNGNEILSSYPFIYSNDNGASVSAQTTDLATPSGYNRIATDGAYWLAGGTISGQGYVANSTNRSNWTRATLTNCTNLYWLAYGGGKYAVTGADSVSGQGRIWYSTDRASWTKTSGGLASGVSGGQLRYGNGYFLTAGSGTAFVERAADSDLTAWSLVALASGWAGGAGKLAYSTTHSRWVIIGMSSGILQAQYSDDNGATWTAATVEAPTLTTSLVNNVVALSGGGFIASGTTAGSLGAAFYSANGTAWVNISGASSFQGLLGLAAK